MKWAGVSVAIGLALVAAAMGPVGWLVLAVVAFWLYRLG